jgi:hypothetical protein
VRAFGPLTLATLAAIGAAATIASPAPAGAAITARHPAVAESAAAYHFNNYLMSVSAVSSSSAWAVGDSSSTGSVTRIEHWNGKSWKQVASPNMGGSTGQNELSGVAAVSRTRAWAVGDYQASSRPWQTMIERWNGRSWKPVASPDPRDAKESYLNAVAATSSASAWAVGHYFTGTGEQTLIEHWNGKSWKQVASPNMGGSTGDNELSGVAAISPSRAWAVGGYVSGTGERTLIERWNGRSWKPVASPNPRGAKDSELDAVTATSSASAWAVGQYYTRTGEQTLIEHWNGKSWKQVPSPDGGGSTSYNELSGVTAISPSRAWAVGVYVSSTGEHALIERWNGRSWKLVASPNPRGAKGSELDAVAATSSSRAWAVGYYYNGTVILTLIERWNGKSWKQVPSPSS